MKRVLRILICCLVSVIVVYFSGYGNLMDDISESLAVTTFIGAVLVLSMVLILLLECYLNLKNKISKLSKRIDELEEKNRATKLILIS